MNNVRQALVLLVLAISLVGCWDVTPSPKQSDIGQGDTASIVFRAGNQERVSNPSQRKVVPNAPATVNLLSGAPCGTLSYQPPAPGSPFVTVTGGTQATKTNHLGQIKLEFLGRAVTTDCPATIEVRVRDKKGTATVVVHAPAGFGSGTHFDPDNPLLVTPGPPRSDLTTKFIVYHVSAARGDAALQVGAIVCVACPTRNDPNFKWGVIWGRRLTISPFPGVQYDLQRGSDFSRCVYCNASNQNRYKIPRSITH